MSSGVDLDVINQHAPNLASLSICDSKIFCSDDWGQSNFLPKLTHCRLMRVSYISGCETKILQGCKNLQVLYQEAGAEITDECIQDLVEIGYLRFLGMSTI